MTLVLNKDCVEYFVYKIQNFVNFFKQGFIINDFYLLTEIILNRQFFNKYNLRSIDFSTKLTIKLWLSKCNNFAAYYSCIFIFYFFFISFKKELCFRFGENVLYFYFSKVDLRWTCSSKIGFSQLHFVCQIYIVNTISLKIITAINVNGRHVPFWRINMPMMT